MTIRPFRIDDIEQVIGLWERCRLTRPWNDPADNAGARDFYRKPGYDMDEVVTMGKRLEADERPRG